MTDFFAEAFSSFHLERNNLVTLFFAEDFSTYFLLHIFPNRKISCIVNQQNFRLNFISCLPFDMGYIQFLTCFNLKLMTRYLDYCEHDSNF